MKNYWVGVISPIHTDALSYINDPESYTGGTPIYDIESLTSMLHDPSVVLNLFKSSTGRYLYSLYVKDQDKYDSLILAYPSLLELGCWEWDGTKIIDLHPSLMSHMPDIWVQDDEDSGHFESRLNLADINLLAGQSQRDFS